MNSREGFIGPPLVSLLLVLAALAAFSAFAAFASFARTAFDRRSAARCVRNLHFCAVAQAIAALDDHPLARRKAGLDRDAVAFGDADAHFAQLDRFVLFDDVDESSLPAAHDGRVRNERRPAPGIEQHANVDELIWKEARILVRELRLELDRARRGIDLVVDARERARGELLLLLAVVGLDRQLFARAYPLHQARQAVLRDGEDDRDRLQLRDDHEAVRVARAHDVARVDQAQAQAPGNRRSDARIGQLQLGVVDL